MASQHVETNHEADAVVGQLTRKRTELKRTITEIQVMLREYLDPLNKVFMGIQHDDYDRLQRACKALDYQELQRHAEELALAGNQLKQIESSLRKAGVDP